MKLINVIIDLMKVVCIVEVLLLNDFYIKYYELIIKFKDFVCINDNIDLL